MKLATLKDDKRDGRLVVVARELTHFADAAYIAPTLQAALDDWANVAPKLRLLADQVEDKAVQTECFHQEACHSPLPRLRGMLPIFGQPLKNWKSACQIIFPFPS